MQHPYFAYTKDDVTAFVAALAEDDALRARYTALVAPREKLLSEEFLTEEYADSVYTQHGCYYEIGAQLERFTHVLGAAYTVEGDTQAAARLRDLMLHVSGFRVWTGPANKDRDVPWHSDLSTTRIALMIAYGYDQIYDFLTDDERRTLADAILRKGVMPLLADWLLPETRIHALDSMGHNWWSVCIALAGTALLPILDTFPEAFYAPIIEEIEKALVGFLTYPGCALFNKVPNYDSQSLFYESTCYFNYGTSELLRYLWHAERYLGRRDTLRNALPPQLSQAILSFAYPYTKNDASRFGFLNFGDSATDVVIHPMARYLRLLGYDTPALSAYEFRTPCGDDMISLIHERRLTNPGSLSDLPLTAFYPQSGYALTRDSWDDDATLLAVKSGYTWNHAHADAGSFVLFDRGIPLFIDSGTCNYGNAIYSSYYRKDDSHNVLLIDHAGQRPEDQVRGSKFPGSLTDTYESADRSLCYVQADATGPLAHLCSRTYRNFLWLDHSTLFIIDDVLCHTPATVQFLLHFDGSYAREEDHVRILGERSAATFYTIAPTEETVTEKEGHPPVYAEKVIPYLEFSTVSPERANLLFHVALLNPDGNPIVERLSGEEAIGARLTRDGQVTEVWFNLRADGRRMHINSNNTIATWDTDAYILMIRRDGTGKERIFYVSASYLRHGDNVKFSSYRKETGEL